ncbi:MAG: mechanosensitive ion channel, partial [Mucilaginibacter polytrichastri]|nr:mechanosensitive ion channel [Mucilaginibacter polytrichastri]
QVNGLFRKLRHLDSVNSGGLRRIGLLQNRISQLMITMAEYRQQIDDNLVDFGYRIFTTQEFSVLFFDKKSDYPSTFRNAIKQTIQLDSQTIQYYIRYNVPTHLFVIAVFAVFFWWIRTNRKLVSAGRNDGEHIFDQVKFVRRGALFPSVLVATTVALFVYDHPPVPFTYIFVSLQVIAIACIIPFVWNKRFVRFWIGISVLFFFYAISNLLLEVSKNERIMLFGLSIVGAVTGALFLRDASRNPQIYLPKARPLFIAYTILQSLAVVLNFFGKLSLAKIFGLTGIFMLWQAILLYLFVQILIESIFLALEKGKNKSRFASYIDFKALEERSKNIVSFAAIVLWVILQAQNFNIADTMYEVLGTWLTNPHKLGSISFTFGGIVVFGIIIWFSIAITRLINYFFDYADQRREDGRSKYRSSMLLVRIAVFTIGFLLAVTASGFPLDKITIVLGALGVGIGLGLQDLVKNLVSGIVIAFEKPMQVGDVIEVEKRKGVVREIGIRASKIAMYEGAEIVVPNGILLSQNLTNWTLSSKNRRVELPIGVAYGTDLEKAFAILESCLKDKENMMLNPGPFVTMQGFGPSSVDFKVFFWVSNPDFESSVRAAVMVDIYKRFTAASISMPFPQQDVYVRFPEGKPEGDQPEKGL